VLAHGQPHGADQEEKAQQRTELRKAAEKDTEFALRPSASAGACETRLRIRLERSGHVAD
jgi:hypothetical protein